MDVCIIDCIAGCILFNGLWNVWYPGTGCVVGSNVALSSVACRCGGIIPWDQMDCRLPVQIRQYRFGGV